MAQWVIIIVLLISVVGGIYGVILLNSLRKKHPFEFLNSFFYYHLLFIIFGIYGILGNLLVQQILLKFELKTSIIEAIAHFFPFFGVPFVLAGWYMLLKFTSELINKNIPQIVAISYFVITTLAFFVYGRFIQMMPEADYASLTQKVIIVFYTIELIITTYVFLTLVLFSLKQKSKIQKKFIIRFIIAFTTLEILKAVTMHFADIHIIIGLYFILLFFTGNLGIIFLIQSHLSKHNNEFVTVSASEDLCIKYHISKREKEIIEEICKGKTNQQIADDLFITLQTVKDHIHNIFKKVEVKNRVQLSQLFNQTIKN